MADDFFEDDDEDDDDRGPLQRSIEERQQSAFISGCRFGNGEGELNCACLSFHTFLPPGDHCAALTLEERYERLSQIIGEMDRSRVHTVGQIAYNLGRLRAYMLEIKSKPQYESTATLHNKQREIVKELTVDLTTTPEQVLARFCRVRRGVLLVCRDLTKTDEVATRKRSKR